MDRFFTFIKNNKPEDKTYLPAAGACCWLEPRVFLLHFVAAQLSSWHLLTPQFFGQLNSLPSCTSHQVRHLEPAVHIKTGEM